MDPKYLIAAVAAVFIADFGMQILQKRKRNRLLDTVSTLLAEKKFDEFNELIDSPEAQKSFPVYNRLFLKLNEAFLKEDKTAIDKAFKEFNGLRMNKVQQEALYKRGFYYYMSAEDKENTRMYYDLLSQMSIKDQETIDVMYDTYILKGYRYLEQIRKQCDDAIGDQKMPFYALLADMYHNKGEEDKAKEYEALIKDVTA